MIQIGARLKALREERGLSQNDVARLFGFTDRQTISAIETGQRRVSAKELVLAVKKLRVSLDYFTDPFRLVGEGKFSWRQTHAKVASLDELERTSGRWIAAYRTLGPQVGHPAPLLRRTLGLTARDSFEDAAKAGERFAKEFDLGETPAARLADVMQRELGVLILIVDAIDGVSGGACRLPTLDTVLINRNEPLGKRNFDLAHELFHILTWDMMAPEHVEDSVEQSKSRIEQLANFFASAILMPEYVLDRSFPKKSAPKYSVAESDGREFDSQNNVDTDKLAARLNAAADELAVTATALRWRLVTTGRLNRAAAKQIPDAALRNNRHPARRKATALPPPFSKPFVETIALATERGHVSVRGAADLLNMTLDDLADLCTAHGLSVPFDL